MSEAHKVKAVTVGFNHKRGHFHYHLLVAEGSSSIVMCVCVCVHEHRWQVHAAITGVEPPGASALKGLRCQVLSS